MMPAVLTHFWDFLPTQNGLVRKNHFGEDFISVRSKFLLLKMIDRPETGFLLPPKPFGAGPRLRGRRDGVW